MSLVFTRVPGGCIVGNNTEIEGNGVTDTNIFGSIVIPYENKGRKVLRIGKFSFRCCTQITHVFIKARITEICYGAFTYCKNLESINIPSSVLKLETSAIGLADNGSFSKGTLIITFEANSKIEKLGYNSICHKENIIIYTCWNKAPNNVDSSIFQTSMTIYARSVFTINKVTTQIKENMQLGLLSLSGR